jgi:hypothetical protein
VSPDFATLVRRFIDKYLQTFPVSFQGARVPEHLPSKFALRKPEVDLVATQRQLAFPSIDQSSAASLTLRPPKYICAIDCETGMQAETTPLGKNDASFQAISILSLF